MANWETIDELRNVFLDKYINSEFELEKACNDEYDLMRAYNGRQILELLQNVDDAFEGDASKKEVAVKITYKDHILEVGNTGTKFTAETIHRLCLGGASNKSATKIGNKGTGFRSLLNDAEWIELYSGNFNIRFSEKYAKELFEKYVDEKSDTYSKIIAMQKRGWTKDYLLCFPIMNCPEEIKKIDSSFDTLIRIKIKESNFSKENGISEQLKQSFYKSLLFLPNINKIILETDKQTKVFEKIIDENNVLLDNGERTEEFFVYKKQATIGDKTADLIIAISKNPECDNSNEDMYCYFPIRNFKTPINAIIHAPFVTNNSRDDIPNDSELINKNIFQEIVIFIKEVAEKLAEINSSVSPIRFATPIDKNNKLWTSEGFNLQEKYYDLMSEAKILPTLNGKYISIKDEPKILNCSIPKEFKGKVFKNLLDKQEEETKNFIRNLAEHNQYRSLAYTENELAEKINELSDNWTVETRVKIFIWWSENYRNSYYIPNLLKDSSDKWIINRSNKIFLPTNTGISDLPEELNWVKLRILQQEYANELILQLKKHDSEKWNEIEDSYKSDKTGDKRILSAFSENLSIKFTEQSSREAIIHPINSQIDSVEKSISFINWFFKNYGNEMQENSELSKIPFNLPNVRGEIKSVGKLYFGKVYSNELAEKLFDNNSFSALMNIDELYTGTDDDGKSFIDFLRKCGVLKFPKIEYYKYFSSNWKFRSYVQNKYGVSFNINYLESYTIENFESLIKKLDTKEIVKWINKDEELMIFLYSKEQNSKTRQQLNWHWHCFESNAYLKFVLNTTPWIELNGKKYEPCNIIKYEKLKDSVEGFYGISEQDLIRLFGKDIVEILDFKENMISVADDGIRKILEALPTFDKSGEISRKLYIDIIKNKAGKLPNYNISNLKVLAKDGKFHPNTEIRYADKKLPKSIEQSEKLISIQPKQSVETIKNWLGVERYKMTLKLKSYSELEKHKDEFIKEVREIKIIVLSTIDDNRNNIDKLKHLQIIPCTKIEATNLEAGNDTCFIDDFGYVEDGNKIYFKVPSNSFSVEELRSKDRFARAIVDICKQVLTLEMDSNLIELIISKSDEGRKERIADEYGIDKWNESFTHLFEENKLSDKICSYFRAKNLSDQKLKEIENLSFSSCCCFDCDYEILIESLKSINEDVNDLSKISEFMNIDISSYWRKKLKGYLDSHYEDYKKICYLKAKQGNKELKSKFLNKLDNYKNFNVEEIKILNSVNIGIEEIAKKYFPELKETVPTEENIDEIYNNNVKTIVKKASIANKDFDYFVENKEAEKSILYFEIPEDIYSQIESFFYADNPIAEDASNIDIKETFTKQTTLKSVEPCHSNSCGKREKSQRSYETQNQKNEKYGEMAEEIAYKELKKSYPNLIWHSKYSKVPADRNNLPPDNIVCDMWVCDAEIGNNYFEVKSATTEFEMTINEYESMKNNKDNYEIVLVNRATYEISRHKFDELDNLKQVSKYMFKFIQENS